MKNIWTKVAAIFATLAGGLLISTAALAVEATNSDTGAGSDNDASVTIESGTTVNSTNNTSINNNIDIYANTGDNSADKNTGDGNVSSGDINGSVSIANLGNENGDFDSLINVNCNGTCDFSAGNSNTGADSDNDASITVTNNVDITVNNDANVNNDVGAGLNTGGNSADKNTGDGSVTTGDINFSVDVVNDLNKNFIGAPSPGEEPAGPGEIPPAVMPSAAKPGQVLAAVTELPITGGLPSWPFLLIAVGFALRVLDRFFRVKLGVETA